MFAAFVIVDYIALKESKKPKIVQNKCSCYATKDKYECCDGSHNNLYCNNNYNHKKKKKSTDCCEECHGKKCHGNKKKK